jgi:hypothetical protein
MGILVAVAGTMSLAADETPLDAAVKWLADKSTAMIRASRRGMADGTAAFPPQVGSHYDAFWLRDYAYMLEGNIGAFTDKELRDACLLFVKSLRDDGAGVDCVGFDGRLIYKPGYGTMGENPVADGSPFTVDVAWRTWDRTRDTDLVRGIIDSLVRCLGATPRSAESGLVFIDPSKEWDRCPYGFTDSIRKTGNELFCSLLFFRSCRQLADLLEVVGPADESRTWRAEADRVAESVRRVFWHPESSLFHAATVRCNQPDIWGSAFAVYLGVATPEQAQAIATYFRDHYGEIVYRGQLRHLPGGMYWDNQKPAEAPYQNGGFWATPVGWFVYTLDLVDPPLADKTFLDMVEDFRAHGVCENVYGEHYYVPDYNASASLPLAGVRAMMARRSAAK